MRRPAWPPRRWGAVLIVLLTALAAHARTWDYQLVWDDPLLLSSIGKHYDQGGIAGLLSAEFEVDPAERLGYYRPVVLLSLWADSRLAARLPQIFHLTNILLHAAVSVLVLALAFLVSGSGRAALLGALAFALHPTHVEPVAFVSSRTDLWAALFALLAASAWVLQRRAGQAAPPLLAWCGAASFALATLSKEAAFGLPLVLLAWDAARPAWGAAAPAGWWRRNRSFLVGWGAALALGAALRRASGIGFGAAAPGGPGSALQAAWEGVQQLPLTLATYLRLLAIPWPLNAYYTRESLAWDGATLAGALLALGVFFAVAGKRHARAGLLCLAWTAGFLLPVLGLVPISGAVLAERFLYLASAGFCLALGCALDAGAARWRFAGSLASGTVLLALGAGTLARQGVWRDPVALFSDQIRTSPTYLDASYNLGTHYHRTGRHREAVELLERVARLDPTYRKGYINLGNSYLELKQYDRAIDAYRALLRLDPENFLAHYDLGNALAAAGRPAEAADSYERALRLRPGHRESLDNLGRASLAVGNFKRAKEAFATIGSLDMIRSFHLSRGLMFARQGRAADARRDLEVLEGLDSPRAPELRRAIADPR